MKTYLCSELGGKFLIKACNIDDAREEVMMWGAEVIGEYDEATGSVTICE